MTEELGCLIPSFKGKQARVRCFAHILNLVVKVHLDSSLKKYHGDILLQAILSQYSQKKVTTDNEGDWEDDDTTLFKDLLDDDSAEDNEDIEPDDADELDPAVDASDNMAIREVVQEVNYSDRVPLLMSNEVKLGWFTIFKVSIQYCDLMI